MAHQFLNYSFRFLFDPEVLYDLEDEKENDLLASLYIEDTINNSTNNPSPESEVSDEFEVTDEDLEQSGNISKDL